MTGYAAAMRRAVLDVGANTVNLLVGDDSCGPVPVHAWKSRPSPASWLGPHGDVEEPGRWLLIEAVAEAVTEARGAGAETLFAYATAVIRDAPNRDQVLDEIAEATGVRLRLLSGVEEAGLTFRAARSWLGWQAGPMLLADIGGGTLELGQGAGRLPDWAVSLPLGARRLTREFLRDGDPPSPRAVRRLRRHVRARLHDVVPARSTGTPVAASKTFQQLARLTGAAPLTEGPFVARRLHRTALRPWIDRLAALPAARRARLPGVSEHRARQSLAGAIVAYEVMRALDVRSVRICPWGLREGILVDGLEGGTGWIPWPALELAA